MDHSSSTWHAPLHVKDTKSEKQHEPQCHLEFNRAVTASPPPFKPARDGKVQKNHRDHQMKQRRDPGTQKTSVIQKIFPLPIWAIFLHHLASTYEGYIRHSYAYSTCCTVAHELAQPCPEPLDPSGWRGPGRCLVRCCAQSQVSTESRSGCNLYSADQVDCQEMPFNSSGDGGNYTHLNEFISKNTLNEYCLGLSKAGRGF